MLKFGHNLEEASGAKHHKIAIPAIFIIDVKGTVRWSHADLDYRTRPSVEQILKAAKELQSGN